MYHKYINILYKLIQKTLEMLTICTRKEFSINKYIFPPHCTVMASQRHDCSVAMLILDQHS